MQTLKRIPEGTIFGNIPLEACKAYPIRLWQGLNFEPRIAYADFNTHQERNILSVKVLPNGGKTAPHPQIVFFVNGPYHVETLSYFKSNVWNWTTWMEFHLNSLEIYALLKAINEAKTALEDL